MTYFQLKFRILHFLPIPESKWSSWGKSLYSLILSTAVIWFSSSDFCLKHHCKLPVRNKVWVIARPTFPSLIPENYFRKLNRNQKFEKKTVELNRYLRKMPKRDIWDLNFEKNTAFKSMSLFKWGYNIENYKLLYEK